MEQTLTPRTFSLEVAVQIDISPEARQWLAARGGQLTIDPPGPSAG